MPVALQPAQTKTAKTSTQPEEALAKTPPPRTDAVDLPDGSFQVRQPASAKAQSEARERMSSGADSMIAKLQNPFNRNGGETGDIRNTAVKANRGLVDQNVEKSNQLWDSAGPTADKLAADGTFSSNDKAQVGQVVQQSDTAYAQANLAASQAQRVESHADEAQSVRDDIVGQGGSFAGYVGGATSDADRTLREAQVSFVQTTATSVGDGFETDDERGDIETARTAMLDAKNGQAEPGAAAPNAPPTALDVLRGALDPAST
jgi:hypothetical protein